MTGSFEFVTYAAEEHEADTDVDTRLLATLLRLPPEVRVKAVYPHPTDPTKIRLRLAGKGVPPGEGLAVVDYTFNHTTIINYAGISRD